MFHAITGGTRSKLGVITCTFDYDGNVIALPGTNGLGTIRQYWVEPGRRPPDWLTAGVLYVALVVTFTVISAREAKGRQATSERVPLPAASAV